MRVIFVTVMFAAGLAHAGLHQYREIRNLELDASGLSKVFIDAGAGAMVVTGVESSHEVVVVATITVDTADAEKAARIIE